LDFGLDLTFEIDHLTLPNREIASSPPVGGSSQ